MDSNPTISVAAADELATRFRPAILGSTSKMWETKECYCLKNFRAGHLGHLNRLCREIEV